MCGIADFAKYRQSRAIYKQSYNMLIYKQMQAIKM